MADKAILEARRLLEEGIPYEEIVERLKEEFLENEIWEIAVIYAG